MHQLRTIRLNRRGSISVQVSNKSRVVVLILCGVMILGVIMARDFPTYLQKDLKEFFEINNLQFSLIYSIYSLPNTIMPFIGGKLTDKYGARMLCKIFQVIHIQGVAMCAGSILIGGLNGFILLLVGRFFSGIGQSNSRISQRIFIVRWSPQQYLTTIQALCNIGKLGSPLGAWLMPFLTSANDGDLFFPLIIMVIISLVSLISAFIITRLDLKNEDQTIPIQNKSQYDIHRGLQQQQSIIQNQQNQHGITKVDFQPIQEQAQKKVEQKTQSNQIQNNQEKNNICQCLQFEALFWIICLAFALKGTTQVFLQMGQEFYMDRYVDQIDKEYAAFLLSLPFIISLPLSPIYSVYVDRSGNRQYHLLFSAFLLLLTHTLIYILPYCPNAGEYCHPINFYLPIILIGIFISIFPVVVNTSMPFIFQKKQLGTAYGILHCLQAVGLSGTPSLIGAIQDSSESKLEGYNNTLLYFLSASSVCFIMCLLILFQDRRTGKRLSLNYTKRMVQVLSDPSKPQYNESSVRKSIVNPMKINHPNRLKLESVDIKRKTSIEIQRKQSIEISRKQSIQIQKKQNIEIQNIDTIQENISTEFQTEQNEWISKQEKFKKSYQFRQSKKTIILDHEETQFSKDVEDQFQFYQNTVDNTPLDTPVETDMDNKLLKIIKQQKQSRFKVQNEHQTDEIKNISDSEESESQSDSMTSSQNTPRMDSQQFMGSQDRRMN